MLFVVIATFGIMGDSIYQAVHDPPGEMTQVIFEQDMTEVPDVFVIHSLNRCGEAPLARPGELFAYTDAQDVRLQTGIGSMVNNNTLTEVIRMDNSILKLPDWNDKAINRQNHIVMQRGALPRIRHV